MTNYALGIIGASGKFGSRIFSLAEKEVQKVFGSSRNPTFPFISTEELFEKSDVLIDVSFWESTQNHINLAVFHKKPLVIGITGYPFDIESILEKPSSHIPILYASNFSIGITLLGQAIKKISTTLPAKKIEIQETHHQSKKDKPSGTALYLAQHTPSENVTIISHRIPEVAFEHQTSFFYEEEEIILTHKAFSRDLFAKGAILAARFLHGRDPGIYHMQDLLAWLESEAKEAQIPSL